MLFGEVPKDAGMIPSYISSAFNKLESILKKPTIRTIEWDILHAAPDKPRPGMEVYADGTNWNPGLGEGKYIYTSALVWSKL